MHLRTDYLFKDLFYLPSDFLPHIPNEQFVYTVRRKIFTEILIANIFEKKGFDFVEYLKNFQRKPILTLKGEILKTHWR